VDDYVEVPDHDQLSGGGKDFSVQVKFNSNDISKRQDIVSKFLSPSWKDWGLLLMESKISFGFEYQVNEVVQYSEILQSNQDYSVAFTYEYQSRQLILYLNSEQVASKILNNDLPNSNEPVSIGRQGGSYNDKYFNGVIDDLVIWERVLSSDDLEAYMDGDLTGQEDGLVGYWDFNEGTGSSLTDQTINGHHGTIYGATWACDGSGDGTDCNNDGIPDDCEEVYDEGILIGAQSGDINGDGNLNILDMIIYVEVIINQ